MAAKKRLARPLKLRFPVLLGLWLGVIAVGCTVVLGLVDLFDPRLWAGAGGDFPLERWEVSFLGCAAVAYWVTLACVPGRVAEARGRSAAWWFSAAVIFSPAVALIGLALMPVERPRAESLARRRDEEDDEDAVAAA